MSLFIMCMGGHMTFLFLFSNLFARALHGLWVIRHQFLGFTAFILDLETLLPKSFEFVLIPVEYDSVDFQLLKLISEELLLSLRELVCDYEGRTLEVGGLDLLPNVQIWESWRMLICPIMDYLRDVDFELEVVRCGLHWAKFRQLK